mmetsp:Transcript_9392/g.13751  ORF Transcript_9392/g.13751 Transcript_9392/m.13751 type:complete len:118 (+) Transcript_9392:471-824(+)
MNMKKNKTSYRRGSMSSLVCMQKKMVYAICGNPLMDNSCCFTICLAETECQSDLIRENKKQSGKPRGLIQSAHSKMISFHVTLIFTVYSVGNTVRTASMRRISNLCPRAVSCCSQHV